MCSSDLVGMTEERYTEILHQRLRVGEQQAVEKAFSTQANGQAPGLANNGSAATLTAATTVTAAIAALEDWLYNVQGYGLQGIIHAPAISSAWMHSANTFMWAQQDGILRTPMGTEISFGAYSGALPNGTGPAAGHTTLYITGRVAVWRTPQPRIFLSPYGMGINRATNQYFGVAERFYALSLDCNLVAGIDTTLAA